MEPDHSLIVLDLEATCWKERGARISEIIEIGAVMLNLAGEAIGEFSTFVKPVLHSELSEFCKELTSITQGQVNGAPGFPDAVHQFRDWIGLDPYMLCSWGFYDRKQLQKDCELHGIQTDWLNRHISVKHQYAKLHELDRPCGMTAALKREGMQLVGTHHRGIDDARNITRIVQRYLDDWKY